MKLTSIIETEYSNISEIHEVSLKTKDSKIRKQMNEMYLICNKSCVGKFGPSHDFKLVLNIIKDAKISYTNEDITAFCFDLLNYEDPYCLSYAGIFLSALIRSHQEKRADKQTYTLYTEHLSKYINYIGQDNVQSEIIIKGHVGFVGNKMISGAINALGEALYNGGNEMKGGKLTVQSAGIIFGSFAEGGELFVTGDAGANVGFFLNGAHIELNQSYSSISPNMQKGKITHQGKVIFNKEE